MNSRTFLLIAVLATGIEQAAACPENTLLTSPSVKPLPPSKFLGISKAMSMCEIISELGPAARDIGSGLYVLQWDVTDGRIFAVSTAGEKTLGVGFSEPIRSKKLSH